MKLNPERLVLTIPEVAELLGISENHCWNLVSRGDIPSVKLGALRRVSRVALERWLDERSESELHSGKRLRAAR